MKKHAAFICGIFALALGVPSHATDRFYRDITEHSPDNRYQVEAVSPDNAPASKGPRVFQSNFTYCCKDAKTKAKLWTRKQGEEGSPTQLFVSDAGWTVIRGAWDDLVVIDKQGKEHGRVNLLEEAFTKEDREKHVHKTTAGPMWSGYSLWYFLDVGEQRFFVVRPWWGHRAIVNLATGKLVPATDAITQAISACERRYVLDELAKGLENRKKGGREECGENTWGLCKAAYLAGVLPVSEAIPSLEKLQDSTYSGSSSTRMSDAGEGKVDPHSYSTFTLRQAIHLSLRRLGKKPNAMPDTQFDVRHEVYEKNHPYKAKVLAGPRHANANQVKKGLKAEQVLDLLGAPDFVSYDTWEYDMDADEPFSLVVRWDESQVVKVEKTKPLWKEEMVRDRQIVD